MNQADLDELKARLKPIEYIWLDESGVICLNDGKDFCGYASAEQMLDWLRFGFRARKPSDLTT